MCIICTYNFNRRVTRLDYGSVNFYRYRVSQRCVTLRAGADCQPHTHRALSKHMRMGSIPFTRSKSPHHSVLVHLKTRILNRYSRFFVVSRGSTGEHDISPLWWYLRRYLYIAPCYAHPAVQLAMARQRREKVRELLTYGFDPSTTKREDQQVASMAAANTFEAAAREFHALKAGGLE